MIVRSLFTGVNGGDVRSIVPPPLFTVNRASDQDVALSSLRLEVTATRSWLLVERGARRDHEFLAKKSDELGGLVAAVTVFSDLTEVVARQTFRFDFSPVCYRLGGSASRLLKGQR